MISVYQTEKEYAEGEFLYGDKREGVCESGFDAGLFEAMKRNGSQAIFCGHDHNNDWCAIYKGVYLVYNLPQNYNLYHLGTNMGFPEEKWNQGVTVTTLHSDGTLDIAPRYNAIYL